MIVCPCVCKKWLFWFFERWLVCRQKPNVLFAGGLSLYTDAQRPAALRGLGNRSTKVQFSTTAE